MAENINSLFENLQFTEIECVQLVDNADQGHSLVGDVKFGLVGKLLSPNLSIENTFVQTFTNIWIEEQAEVMSFHLRMVYSYTSFQVNISCLASFDVDRGCLMENPMSWCHLT
ncbi:hypothetical protein V6N13_139914 [Hibiscus sabdariffa]|uniref:Uncharacterized protein n=2 Tax=Hibiscus sabdariffa TaxID=183260 RepID=A0ABR2AB32_9ROSI